MIRFTGLLSVCFLTLIVFENPAAGQAMVEYGVAAGAAAASTAPARGLKDSVGGAFSSLDKTLKSAEDHTGAPPASKRKTPAGARPAPAAPSSSVVRPVTPPPNYEDPATIQAGTGYEELVRRFGPPALEFTNGPNRKTLSYLSKGGAIQVLFQDGKVTSAEKPPK